MNLEIEIDEEALAKPFKEAIQRAVTQELEKAARVQIAKLSREIESAVSKYIEENYSSVSLRKLVDSALKTKLESMTEDYS